MHKKTDTKYRSFRFSARELCRRFIIKRASELLANPVAVFNYQAQLASNKLELKHLYIRQKQLIGLINAIPERKERLQEQHEMGIMDLSSLKEKIGELNSKEIRHRDDLKETEQQISQHTLSESYIRTLELFSNKYKKRLDDMLNSKTKEDRRKHKAEAYDILHELVEDVVVYTRPVKKSDIVAGKKKPNQQMPYRIHIKLKLPQDILSSLQKSSIRGW